MSVLLPERPSNGDFTAGDRTCRTVPVAADVLAVGRPASPTLIRLAASCPSEPD